MTTTPTSKIKKTRTPRKSPLQQAIVAADKAVTRANKRKDRSFKRIAKMEAKIAEILGNSGQFDALIAQLQANAQNLRQVAGMV